MSAISPGSFEEFITTHSELPTQEQIAAYTGELAVYKAVITPKIDTALSPDFIIIQRQALSQGE